MLWSWGSYRYGQLGLGEVTMKMNPRPVQTLCGCHVHRIAAGSMHSSAVIGDSRLIESLTYNLSQDLLSNPWAIDIRGLSAKKTV